MSPRLASRRNGVSANSSCSSISAFQPSGPYCSQNALFGLKQQANSSVWRATSRQWRSAPAAAPSMRSGSGSSPTQSIVRRSLESARSRSKKGKLSGMVIRHPHPTPPRLRGAPTWWGGECGQTSELSSVERVLRVALAQVNPIVGDLDGNARLIKDRIKEARDKGADVVCFPELALTGYPPEDLVLKPSFVRDNLKQLEKIRHEAEGAARLELEVTDVALEGAPSPKRGAIEHRMAEPLEGAAEIYTAVVLGIHDYVHKQNFKKVLIGMSGGVDSALTAAVAADALGPENVIGVRMPSRHTSAESLDDAG